MKQRAIKKTVVTAGAFALLTVATIGAVTFPAKAQEQALPQVVPVQPGVPSARARRVALLPVANLSGEKDVRQRRDKAIEGEEELRKRFTENGFQIVYGDAVQKALSDEQVDVNDEEFHNRTTLFNLGKSLGADLVVFVVITDVEQQRVKTPLTNSDELVAKVKTKTWLLDVPSNRAILSAKRQESQARNMWFAGLDSGARLMRNTVAGCVRDVLRDFFSTHSARQ